MYGGTFTPSSTRGIGEEIGKGGYSSTGGFTGGGGNTPQGKGGNSGNGNNGGRNRDGKIEGYKESSGIKRDNSSHYRSYQTGSYL